MPQDLRLQKRVFPSAYVTLERHNRPPRGYRVKIRHLVRVAVSLVLFLVFTAYVGGALPLRLLDQLEHYAYDARLRLTMPQTVDPRIVIVDVDDKSMRQEGQWPWPRDTLAQLTNNLFQQYHVKLVAFDIMFSEADRSLDLALLNRLENGALKNDAVFENVAQKLRPDLERDQIFAASLMHHPALLGYTFSQSSNFGDTRSSGQLPPPAIGNAQTQFPHLEFPRASAYVSNLSVLAQAASQGYYSNPYVDEDGVFRRVGLLQEYQGGVYLSLDMAVLQVLSDNAPLDFVFDTNNPADYNNAHLDALRIGKFTIPVDRNMAALVPYRGYVRSFPYVSAADVIAGRASRAVLQNAIVYVGTSAPGLLDLRSTPVGAVYPGVEVHANLLSGVLDGRVKEAQPQYARGAQVLLLLILAAIVTWITMTRSILVSSGVTLVLIILIVAGNLLVWQYGNFVFPLATPLLYLVILFVLQSLYGFFIESRGKRHLSRMFSQYIPPELVEEMDERQEGLSMASENRELTVLFSDVRGFTGISESLNPRDLSELMNDFLTPMTRVIHHHRGTIDKYMGDAIMAFWGAPLRDPEHARHALEAALDMQRTLGELNADFAKRGWPELHMGVGLNTGGMNVGDMGSEFRRAYTVLGDAVNLGSRLEGLTKQYGVAVICSETTRAAVPDFAFLELDRVRVKGKEQPVAIYEPLGERTSLGRETIALLARHKQALIYFRARDWDRAEAEFFALQQAAPQHALYRLYLDRIAHFRTQPPEAAWDGVFTYSTK